MSKLFTLPTIGRVDVGDIVGFQATMRFKVGDEIDLKYQVPKTAPAYGKARVVEVARKKPHDYVQVVRFI